MRFVFFFTPYLENYSTELEAQIESNTDAENKNLEKMNVSLNERLQEMKSEFDIQNNIISVYESQIKGIIF